MKSTSIILSLFTVLSTVAAKNIYNGDMRFFLADLAPTYPCHPLYERDYTWIQSDEENPDRSQVRYVLEGLAKAGFNGVRLPIWPESDKVSGPNPNNPAVDVDHEWCTQLTYNIFKVIEEAEFGDEYYKFYTYLAPGLDNKLYQEDLTTVQYSDWIQKVFLLKPTFLSPFSANVSPLEMYSIPDKSKMQDRATMFELDVLAQLRAKVNIGASVPILIGPDRATVEHTLNVLESYNDTQAIRPEYRIAVDVIGTQARYGDQTAISHYYNELKGNNTAFLRFCTLCSQEWNREEGMGFGYGLQGKRVPNGYWSNYKKYWGKPQPPASQALVGGLAGYVAEAAVPRFVSRSGNVNTDRDWTTGEKMIDTDSERDTYDDSEGTVNRSMDEPLSGFRKSTKEQSFMAPCSKYGTETDDRLAPAYTECSIRFTKRMFELNDMNPITAYVNTPVEVLAFSEKCVAGTCETEILYVGIDHYLVYDPDVEHRFIFENDSAEGEVFQVAFIGATYDLLNEAARQSFVISAFAVACLGLANLL